MAKKTEVPKTALPVNDAWTGMLAVSLLALVVASVLLYLDWNQYSGKGPADPKGFQVSPSLEQPPADKDGGGGAGDKKGGAEGEKKGP
jgi:hypothetical protein